MHTTLALLKSVKACVPGYGRQISFFGTKSSLKDQKIPLSAVALIGGKEDASWALTNGIIFDAEEYERFYRRQAVSVFKSLCSSNIYSNAMREYKHPTIKEFVERSMTIHTFEELEIYLKEARLYNFDHTLWSNVIRDLCWSSPASFIDKCIEILEKTYTTNNNWSFPRELQNPYDPKDRARVRATSPVLAPVPTLDVEDVEDDDAEDEDDTPRRGRGRSSVGSKSKSVPIKCYWISTTRKELSPGQNLAHMLDEDPYSFLGKLEFKMPKGMKIVVENGVPVMRAEVTDSKNMFYLIRELTARSEHHEDQDGSTAADDDSDD